MTIHLPADLEDSIRAEVATGRYASEDALVAAVLREHLGRSAPAPTAPDDRHPEPDPESLKPFWERIEELRKTVPDEEWAKLPDDGAEQLDHYIYGSPKRPTA